MAGSIIAYAAAGVLGLGLLSWRFKTEPTTYGSASWLAPWPAMKRGLFKNKGILVGDWTGLLPVFYDDTHSITFGASGSGKGVGAIQTNLQRALFAFVNDPGGENAAIAIKAWRQKGLDVAVINPFGMFTEQPWDLPVQGFNPLDILDPQSPHLAADAMLIAELLTPRTGTEAGSSLFFKDAAQGFLRALLMHVVTTYPASEQHLGTIYALVNASPDEWEALLEAMQDNDAGDKLIARAANALARSEQQAPEEFSAVMSTIQQDASWLADPIVRENLKRSDVDFSVLKGVTRDGRTVTGGIIVVILPLEYAQSHAAISRLAMGCAIWEMQRKPLAREKVLFLLDEAAALGKISRFPNWLATLRKYRTVLWPIFQNVGQVKALYGQEWQGLIANCGLRQFIGVNDLETAQYVSAMIGDVTTKSRSRNAKDEVTISETKRPLMTPNEILTLDHRYQLVFIGNLMPMKLIKTPYWERPELRGAFHRNPYQKGDAPLVIGSGFKALKGRIVYGLAWALTPHPLAALLYFAGLGVLVSMAFGGG